MSEVKFTKSPFIQMIGCMKAVCFIKKATGNMWSQSPNHSRDCMERCLKIRKTWAITHVINGVF